MSEEFFSTIKRRMTRKSRSPASSISSLSAVSASDSDENRTPMHISPPITPPLFVPHFGDDLDLNLSKFEAYRPAPSPPRDTAPRNVSHAQPSRPPRSPEVYSFPTPSRPAPPPPSSPSRSSGESYSYNKPFKQTAVRRKVSTDEISAPANATSSATANWRSQMVNVAMSYATLTSSNPNDFIATTTARAHHNVVLRRLSDPATTELEALAVLRAYLDQVHTSSRGRPSSGSRDSRDF